MPDKNAFAKKAKLYLIFVSGEFEKKKIAITPSTLSIKIHFFCLLVIYASFF